MPQRVFLDWSLPLLPALTDWLLPAAPQAVAADLSQTVVIVPTADAGRRLREALGVKAGERGLLSPQIVTPEVLISWSTPEGPPVAGRGEAVTAWASVLAALDLDEWRALFPIDPVSQDLAWAVQAAGDLLRLRRTLEEGARTLGLAALDLGTGHPEAARWEALARLEKLAVGRLEAGGWRDSTLTRLAAARQPILPEGVTRVVLAGVPDSIRLVRVALESLVKNNAVEVVTAIHAPSSLAESFDRWGRPLPEVWTQRDIRLPMGNDTISLLMRPEDEAAALLKKLTTENRGDKEWATGTADPEVSAPLRRQAAAAGVAVFDPEGTPLVEHEVSWLLRTLTQLLRSGAWAAAGQLLRIPDVLRAVARAADAGNSLLNLLREWDEFQAARLPQTIRQAIPLADHWVRENHDRRKTGSVAPEELNKPVLPAVLRWFDSISAHLENVPLTEALEAFVETVYGARHFTAGPERQRFTAALTAWQEAVVSVEMGASAFTPELTVAARLDVAASLVREARLYSAHDDDAQALHGWLELPWQDAPHLVIAGMNEGLVPDSLQGDAWLPDSVRGALDLKTNDTRLARDSYLLTAMIESRRRDGSVLLLAARQTAAGDPLKPSRLLLRCPAADLPQRALWLFPREVEETAAKPTAPSWKRAWPLAVPPPVESAPVFRRLSVTAFTDYLKCPFRFYLKHVLKMEEYDASQAELDARAFGSLFHDTMQVLHLNEALRNSRDAGVLTAFLHQAMELKVEETYGNRLTIPVAVQMETLRNTLAKAAELHAAERAAGWLFKEVEIDFPSLPGSDEPVNIDGVEIRGRIDLIEEHPTGGIRILDYKTSAKAVPPSAAHLKPVKTTEGEPAWKFTEAGGKVGAWQNLQLPLYARIMSRHYGKPVAVGYVNLPRALGEAKVEMWEGVDETLLDSAESCAKGVIASIRAARFWPPAEKIKYDDFEPLIFDEAVYSFDAVQLKRTASMAEAGQFHPGLPTS